MPRIEEQRERATPLVAVTVAHRPHRFVAVEHTGAVGERERRAREASEPRDLDPLCGFFREIDLVGFAAARAEHERDRVGELRAGEQRRAGIGIGGGRRELPGGLRDVAGEQRCHTGAERRAGFVERAIVERTSGVALVVASASVRANRR